MPNNDTYDVPEVYNQEVDPLEDFFCDDENVLEEPDWLKESEGYIPRDEDDPTDFAYRD